MGFSGMMQTERGRPLLGSSACLLALSSLASRLGSRGCVHACAPSSGASRSVFTRALDPPLFLYVWAALAPREPLQEQQTGGCGRGCRAGGAGAREALACGLRCELRRGWGRGGRPGVHSSVCDCRLHTGLRCPWEVACCLSSWVCGPGRQPLWTRALACC